MENFTPYSGLFGGMLIGIAAVLLLVANGHIAGISGIVSGLLAPGDEKGWRWMFVLGLWIGAAAYVLASGGLFPVEIPGSWPLMAVAGLIVGFGTRMGGGCTSGHGVCGIARFSKRSIVATVVFIGSAMITVFITRHVLGGGA
jgi:uncharacterized membrane protein YedE/YeeE